MGSIIQATPMLQAIRQKFPEAEITFVSTQANKNFLQKIDLIDTIITVNDKGLFKLLGSTLNTIVTLIKKRPDVYIDLEIYSNYSTLVALFSLSKNRIGFYLRDSSFRMGIYTHMMFFNPRVPISGVYLQIARLFGPIEKPISLYPLANTIPGNALKLPTDSYIVVNPNASDLRIERRWAADNFVQLITKILEANHQLTVMLIGSPAEHEYTHEIAKKVNSPRVTDLSGKTSIDELIAVIKNAQLVITNDTGPMHISFACNTPAVCLFGPCSPDQYGYSGKSTIIYKGLYCSPCVHDFKVPPCGGDNMCMKMISVEEVFTAVEKTLRNSDETSFNNSHPEYELDTKVFGLVKRTT